MKNLTITTLSGDINLSIPESLNEITFDQFAQLQNENLTAFEIISLLTGADINQLYEVEDFKKQNESFQLHIDVLLYSIKTKTDLIMPKRLSVIYQNKKVKINLKKPLMRPVAACIEAKQIIEDEINANRLLCGDEWQNNFNPSIESYRRVVTCYLSFTVTGKAWPVKDNIKKIIGQISAAHVLAIAKYFFNNYPDLNGKVPGVTIYAKVLAKVKTLLSVRRRTYFQGGGFSDENTWSSRIKRKREAKAYIS